MILPRERTIYANLNTSFTDFGELLAELNGNRHSGFVRVDFPGSEGVLFMVQGEIVHALDEAHGERMTGTEAVNAIKARAATRGGQINVDGAAPDLVHLLSQVLDSQPLYKDLTSSFTSLERLFAKLQQDALTGYVEVVISDGAGSGLVLFERGVPVESVFTSGADALTGAEARTAVVQRVNTLGGTFNVYRAPSALRDELDEPPITVADVSPLLAFWGEVCAGVEEVADSLSTPGRFRTALKEVLVSRANTYPFLDPFSGEFDYREGRVSFEGALPAEFSRALGACLGDTVVKLAFQLKRADLDAQVRSRLAGASEKHAAVIQRWDLGDDVRELVA